MTCPHCDCALSFCLETCPGSLAEAEASSTTWTGLPYTPPEEWTKADERESNMETWDEELGS